MYRRRSYGRPSYGRRSYGRPHTDDHLTVDAHMAVQLTAQLLDAAITWQVNGTSL